MTERQNIEWKQSWHDDYLKWICGFANLPCRQAGAIGGVIYIGKDDTGQVVGLEEYQTLLETIPNKIRNSIWNEGLLPYGLDVASLKTEHNSRPRNPKIADACFKSGYIDAWGRSTLKIIDTCKEAGLPEPEIIEKDGGVQVTLFKSESGTMGGTMGGTIRELSNRQVEILGMIQADNKISIRDLAKKLKINVSATQTHLESLKEKGIISREGGTRGYWKVILEE